MSTYSKCYGMRNEVKVLLYRKDTKLVIKDFFPFRFTDVVAKWPGSQHDSATFDDCGLKVDVFNENLMYK
jgi:hypothetical protein